MLETGELRQLTRWCRARRVQWQPGVADDGRPAVLLLARHGMMLLLDESEWRLLDGPGQVVAAASGLSELLDAIDAGLAEADPLPRPPEPAFTPTVAWAG